jgi:hypothetical protein
VIWQSILDVVDAIESWVAGQSYWVQVVVLLAVLGPLCYLLAGLIDRVVETVLAWHSRADSKPGDPAAPTETALTEKAGTDRAVADKAATAKAER